MQWIEGLDGWILVDIKDITRFVFPDGSIMADGVINSGGMLCFIIHRERWDRTGGSLIGSCPSGEVSSPHGGDHCDR